MPSPYHELKMFGFRKPYKPKFFRVLALCTAIGISAGGCVEVNPYIDILKNPAGTDLTTLNLLSDSDSREITQYIKKQSRFDACLVLKGGQLIYQYGDVHTPFNSASVRKSIFSALYGIAESKGIIKLDMTLEELGVDDQVNPLTAIEKKATLRHLLTARSGIYLPSLGESAGMKRRKPLRGTFSPNEHFYYNNWDFNALPIILEKATSKKLGDLIMEWLAIPLGMKDFTPQNVTYEYGPSSSFPQTRVYISAEDLARFSSLFTTQGKWGNKQIIPHDWVKESTTKVSFEPQDRDLVEHPFMEGYAYLWWIDEDEETIWADGAGGHFCIIDQKRDLVVVVRNNTGMSAASLLFYNADSPYEDNESGNKIYKFIRSKLN